MSKLIIRLAKPAIMLVLLPRLTELVDKTESDVDDKFLKMFITFINEI